MPPFLNRALLSILAALCPLGAAQALTIYRIGGADLPPPMR